MRTTNKIYIAFIMLFSFSCEDFVDVDVPNSMISSEVVFEKDETAIAAIKGVYHQLFAFVNYASGGQNSVTITGGLSADELTPYIFTTFALTQFHQNEVSPINPITLNIWSSAYNTIYMANAMLEGLDRSGSITDGTKKQLEGEARFVWAFTYFYLVNLFGDVPLITNTDYNENALASRVPKENIYEQIVQYLEEARDLLSDEYITSERTHPNRLGAAALLARVYLYLEDWTMAENLATEVISAESTYGLCSDLNNVFLANSEEAIWQIAPIGNSRETREGNTFIIVTATPLLSLDNAIINAFEEGDDRKMNWVGTFDGGGEDFFYPYKYKIRITNNPTEYSMVLRLAEQYLIRAEARVQQGNITGAQGDINAIRNRAGLENTGATTQSELLDAILQERRVELFTEWGHRWLDLKRTGKADAVLGTIKPGWKSTDVLYPIPDIELRKNPNLTQNDGY